MSAGGVQGAGKAHPIAHAPAAQSSGGHAAAAPPKLPTADLEAALFTLESMGTQRSEHAAEANVKAAKAARDQEIAKAQAAEDAAKAASKHASTWGKIASTLSIAATCVGIAAAAASVVATGGASTFAIIALAGTLTSASSPLVGKCCGKTAGDVTMWAGIGASLIGGGGDAVGSLLATDDAATSSAAAAAKTTADAARGSTPALATKVARFALPLLHGLEGGLRASSGFAKGASDDLEAKATDDTAEATAHRARERKAQEDIDEVIDQLRDLEKSMERAVSTIMQIGVEQRNTKAMLVAQIGRS